MELVLDHNQADTSQLIYLEGGPVNLQYVKDTVFGLPQGQYKYKATYLIDSENIFFQWAGMDLLALLKPYRFFNPLPHHYRHHPHHHRYFCWFLARLHLPTFLQCLAPRCRQIRLLHIHSSMDVDYKSMNKLQVQ